MCAKQAHHGMRGICELRSRIVIATHAHARTYHHARHKVALFYQLVGPVGCHVMCYSNIITSSNDDSFDPARRLGCIVVLEAKLFVTSVSKLCLFEKRVNALLLLR